jgi:5-hydroxyisourate hydrolase-like protein (transthyretin family)
MRIYKNARWAYFLSMKTFIRVASLVFVSLCLVVAVNAQTNAALSGIVKDSKGQPVQGAEIRIQGSDANKIGKIHTNANGRYNYPALETGTYNVTLVVDGAVKASINNVRTKAGENQTLNFDMHKGGLKPSGPGKHFAWRPAQTGSHLGTWVEVDDKDPGMPIGMQLRMENAGNSLARQIQNTGLQGFPTDR